MAEFSLEELSRFLSEHPEVYEFLSPQLTVRRHKVAPMQIVPPDVFDDEPPPNDPGLIRKMPPEEVDRLKAHLNGLALKHRSGMG